jgi:hypothetical protein
MIMAAKDSTKSPRFPLDPAALAHRLEGVRCVILVSCCALERQASDYDPEIALALKRAAVEPLTVEIELLLAA